MKLSQQVNFLFTLKQINSNKKLVLIMIAIFIWLFSLIPDPFAPVETFEGSRIYEQKIDVNGQGYLEVFVTFGDSIDSTYTIVDKDFYDKNERHKSRNDTTYYTPAEMIKLVHELDKVFAIEDVYIHYSKDHRNLYDCKYFSYNNKKYDGGEFENSKVFTFRKNRNEIYHTALNAFHYLSRYIKEKYPKEFMEAKPTK